MKDYKDIAYFVSWCIEQYKKVLGCDGASASEYLSRNGVLEYLASNYDVLHTQSSKWIMEEINQFIKERS